MTKRKQNRNTNSSINRSVRRRLHGDQDDTSAVVIPDDLSAVQNVGARTARDEAITDASQRAHNNIQLESSRQRLFERWVLQVGTFTYLELSLAAARYACDVLSLSLFEFLVRDKGFDHYDKNLSLIQRIHQVHPQLKSHWEFNNSEITKDKTITKRGCIMEIDADSREVKIEWKTYREQVSDLSSVATILFLMGTISSEMANEFIESIITRTMRGFNSKRLFRTHAWDLKKDMIKSSVSTSEWDAILERIYDSNMEKQTRKKLDKSFDVIEENVDEEQVASGLEHAEEYFRGLGWVPPTENNTQQPEVQDYHGSGGLLDSSDDKKTSEKVNTGSGDGSGPGNSDPEDDDDSDDGSTKFSFSMFDNDEPHGSDDEKPIEIEIPVGKSLIPFRPIVYRVYHLNDDSDSEYEPGNESDCESDYDEDLSVTAEMDKIDLEQDEEDEEEVDEDDLIDETTTWNDPEELKARKDFLASLGIRVDGPPEDISNVIVKCLENAKVVDGEYNGYFIVWLVLYLNCMKHDLDLKQLRELSLRLLEAAPTPASMADFDSIWLSQGKDPKIESETIGLGRELYQSMVRVAACLNDRGMPTKVDAVKTLFPPSILNKNDLVRLFFKHAFGQDIVME